MSRVMKRTSLTLSLLLMLFAGSVVGMECGEEKIDVHESWGSCARYEEVMGEWEQDKAAADLVVTTMNPEELLPSVWVKRRLKEVCGYEDAVEITTLLNDESAEIVTYSIKTKSQTEGRELANCFVNFKEKPSGRHLVDLSEDTASSRSYYSPLNWHESGERFIGWLQETIYFDQERMVIFSTPNSEDGNWVEFSSQYNLFRLCVRVSYFAGGGPCFWVSNDLTVAEFTEGSAPSKKVAPKRKIDKDARHEFSGSMINCEVFGYGRIWYQGIEDDEGNIIDFGRDEEECPSCCFPKEQFASCHGLDLSRVNREKICVSR